MNKQNMSNATIESCLSEAATDTGWHKSGHRLWMRGADFKVAIDLRRPRCCNFYHIYILLYLNPDIELSCGQEDSSFRVEELIGDKNPFLKALYFDPGDWVGGEMERRVAVVRLIVDDIVPVAKQMGSREGLLEVVRLYDAVPLLTTWTRKALGLPVDI